MATSEDTLNRFMKYIDDDHITTRKLMENNTFYFEKTGVVGFTDIRYLLKLKLSPSKI